MTGTRLAQFAVRDHKFAIKLCGETLTCSVPLLSVLCHKGCFFRNRRSILIYYLCENLWWLLRNCTSHVKNQPASSRTKVKYGGVSNVVGLCDTCFSFSSNKVPRLTPHARGSCQLFWRFNFFRTAWIFRIGVVVLKYDWDLDHAKCWRGCGVASLNAHFFQVWVPSEYMEILQCYERYLGRGFNPWASFCWYHLNISVS